MGSTEGKQENRGKAFILNDTYMCLATRVA
jgi:hypothetical protein